MTFNVKYWPPQGKTLPLVMMANTHGPGSMPLDQTVDTASGGRTLSVETLSVAASVLRVEQALLGMLDVELKVSVFVEQVLAVAELGLVFPTVRLADIFIRFAEALKRTENLSDFDELFLNCESIDQALVDLELSTGSQCRHAFLDLLIYAQTFDIGNSFQGYRSFWNKRYFIGRNHSIDLLSAVFFGSVTCVDKLDSEILDQEIFAFCKNASRVSETGELSSLIVGTAIVPFLRQELDDEVVGNSYFLAGESRHSLGGNKIWVAYQAAIARKSSKWLGFQLYRGPRLSKATLGKVSALSPDQAAHWVRDFIFEVQRTWNPTFDTKRFTNDVYRLASLVLESPAFASERACLRAATDAAFEGIRWSPNSQRLWRILPVLLDRLQAYSLAEYCSWENVRRFPENSLAWVALLNRKLDSGEFVVAERLAFRAREIHHHSFILARLHADSIAAQPERLAEATQIIRDAMQFERRGYKVGGFIRRLQRWAARAKSRGFIMPNRSASQPGSESETHAQIGYAELSEFERAILYSGRLKKLDFEIDASTERERTAAIEELKAVVDEEHTAYGQFLLSKNLSHLQPTETNSSFFSSLVGYLQTRDVTFVEQAKRNLRHPSDQILIDFVSAGLSSSISSTRHYFDPSSISSLKDQAPVLWAAGQSVSALISGPDDEIDSMDAVVEEVVVAAAYAEIERRFAPQY